MACKMTKNQWLEIWTSVKLIEREVDKFPSVEIGSPMTKKRIKESLKEIRTEAFKIKQLLWMDKND